MHQRETARTKKLAAALLRRVKGWEIETTTKDGGRFIDHKAGLIVVASYAVESDGQVWLHVSISRMDGRLPSYKDLCRLHHDFVGDDQYAYQAFPPKSKHVNLHPGVLHLWHCCDENPLPEFSAVVQGVRTI